MKAHAMRLAVAGLLMVMATGCATQKSWVYRSGSYADRPSVPMQKSVAVLPFDDGRENANKNRLAIYLIPLIPAFGWADFSVPEGSQMHVTSGLWVNYKPTEDFPKALAQEFTAAGLFREAYFDFKKGESDLVVRGRIVSTRYKGTIISYGLSAYGPLLWFVGFPSGTVYNDLSVELSCLDSKTGATLFTKSYTAEPYSKVAWIYVMPDDFNYPVMLGDVYRQFIQDLRRALPSPAKP